MTKAYAVGHIFVTNEKNYVSEYASKAGVTLEAFGGRYIVRGGEISYDEGNELSARSVVIEFPDRQSALGWIHSEQYQAIIRHRKDNSTGTFVIVDGVSL
jgi:uncharacterized protein (DUF1330 family)